MFCINKSFFRLNLEEEDPFYLRILYSFDFSVISIRMPHVEEFSSHYPACVVEQQTIIHFEKRKCLKDRKPQK